MADSRGDDERVASEEGIEEAESPDFLSVHREANLGVSEYETLAEQLRAHTSS